MRGQRSVLCQCHSSRTTYHAITDWLLYWINLFTIVPVGFQQKKISPSTIISTLNFFSSSVLISGIPNGASSVLFPIFVLYINSIVETKYKVLSIKIGEINQVVLVIITM